jgi:hypothetical protein
MSAGNWAGAEEVLRLGDAPSAQTSMLVGVCQYYEDKPEAEATLRAVPNVTDTQLCIRDYLLGRIAQKRGDLGRAFALYGRSAQWERNFFPSTYHGVRLMLQRGDAGRAAAILDGFTRRFPAQRNAPDVIALREAIRSRTVPPDKEFVVVSD